MKDSTDVFEYLSIVIGSAYGIVNIKNILGIIILVIQLVWLLVKFITKIVEHIKNKKPLENLDGNVTEIIDKTQEVIDALDKGDINGRDNE